MPYRRRFEGLGPNGRAAKRFDGRAITYCNPPRLEQSDHLPAERTCLKKTQPNHTVAVDITDDEATIDRK